VLPFIGQIRLAVIILGLVLSVAACNSTDPGQDLPTLTPVQAQVAPEADSTQIPEPAPAELPQEIVEPASPVSPTLPEEEPTMAPADQAISPIPGSETAVIAAIADLAQRLGVTADEIRLISIETQQWSDASLGCPQEGFMYAQVITPGYLIVLEAQNQRYAYHTDQTDNVVLCQE
jgi:hypothetical protein